MCFLFLMAEREQKKPERLTFWFFYLVNPLRFELRTVCLEGRCSIQLSYESSPYLGSGILNCSSRNRTPKDSALALSGRQDSNLRPSGPKPDALPGCATPRFFCYLTEICLVCKFTRENFESSCGIG